jgi:hypothetical protein
MQLLDRALCEFDGPCRIIGSAICRSRAPVQFG